MNQASDEELDDVGSISSASLEPPPTGSQDEEDDNFDEEGGDDGNHNKDDDDDDKHSSSNNNNNDESSNNDANPTEESNEDEQAEDQKIREQTKPVAAFEEKKTNIEYRLTQAHRSHIRDPARKRSKDVIRLATKLSDLRKNLEGVSPMIKAYQQANKEVRSARGQLYANIADISIETPLYARVGKKLDDNSISEARTTGAAAEGIEASRTQSMMSVHQVVQAPQSVLEAEYEKGLVGYIEEWQEAVNNKVDNLMQAYIELRTKQHHYQEKVEKLREEKSQLEAKGKEFGRRKLEKLVRNEEKHRGAMDEYEEKASEVCHVLESAVDLAWLDLMPLVKRTITWEARRYGDDDVHYGGMFRTVLESLDEDIAKIEREETAEDLEAALSVQKERNRFLRGKLDRLQMAISSGDWETKNELFRNFDLM